MAILPMNTSSKTAWQRPKGRR